MPIFGKADAGLPVVTQLMQVNLEDDAEVLRFWRRVFAMAEYNDQLVLEQGKKSGKTTASSVILDLETDHNKTDEAFSSMSLERAARIEGTTIQNLLLSIFKYRCQLAVTVINTLYETGSVPIKTLALLRKDSSPIKNQINAISVAAEEALKQPETGDEMLVPIKKFMASRALAPIYHLIDEVEKMLFDIWRETAKLSECPECKNVFLVRREWQSFCSARCSSRARQRRHRNSVKVTP